MSFDSLYKLSLIMNMVDNLSGPMGKVSQKTQQTTSRMEQMNATFGGMASTGTVMAGVGNQIEEAMIKPYIATFDTKRAIGELASLGVQDLKVVEDAAKDFSSTFAGTSKAEFITAAYDIKSGISSLSDEGIASYTRMAGVTATATKSTIATMTDLFATGYGIYKGYYSQMSDEEFAAMFGSGIAASVQQFKTTGDGMSDAIKNLGAAATNAQVPLEEQLSVLGMLQATMSGGEAGTKYKAFLRSAVSGGKELGLSFVDANNQMLSMPEIMDLLRGKFGETMDAAEKLELQKAFGDQEAVALIDLMYNKTDDLQNNIVSLYNTMGQGETQALKMADAINSTDPSKFDVMKQKMHNVAEELGNAVAPAINGFLDQAGPVIEKTGQWISSHQKLAGVLMTIVMILGGFLTVGGAAAAVIGGIGMMSLKCVTGIQNLKIAFTVLIPILKSAALGSKSFILGLVGMAKQAIVTAVQALPGLIAGVWSFTAALLANPVTWIVLGIVALIAALVLLWKNWDKVVSFVSGIWSGFVEKIRAGADWIKSRIDSVPDSFLLVLSVIAPFVGIPALIIKHWGQIKSFFGNLFTSMKEKAADGIQKIKNLFINLPQTFKESGKKIMLTFAQGIVQGVTAPVNAVKNGLQKIRNMLPFSDAKTGPLSKLTLSGSKVMTTFATGMEKTQNAPAEAAEKSLKAMGLDTQETGKETGRKAPTAGTPKQDTNAPTDGGKERTTIIQKIVLNVNLKTIEDLKKLKKLVEEIEEMTNGGDGKGEPEPTPA